MENALRNRLTFGPMMLLVLFGLLWLDAFVEHHTVGAIHIAHGNRNVGIGGTGISLLLLLLAPLATTELATLFAAEKVKPYRLIATVGAGCMVLHAFLTQFPWFQPIAASTFAFNIVFIMLLAAFTRVMRRQTQEAITRMAGTVLASLYLGGLAWFIVALRVKHSFHGNGQVRFEGSTTVILMFLIVVKFTDIGAYFGGRALGRHKLIAWLSPGKTWEGLACGMISAGLLAIAFVPLVPNLSAPKAFILGMALGGIGQAGDLLESLMKRDAEVKDSGNLIPGFGGVLDVIDSPLFAAPFAYLLFSLL
ncbi:MAG: phosphatidate cytidylyltransferase [Phycisphaerae bacterium]|nr:phosphatidate cytidylyltransferase [Phycisphaerae bacterium]